MMHRMSGWGEDGMGLMERDIGVKLGGNHV